MNKNWNYGVLDDAVNKGSSNISLNKIKEEDGLYPVFGAKGFMKNVSFYHQEKDYLALIKDGAGIGRVSKHPSKSSVLATMQYVIPKEEYNIDFIKYFLEGLDFEDYRTGSTIPHIYYKDYKNARFPLVGLNEQQQIVILLDKVSDAIEKAKLNIEKNIENAKELFQSKLNDIFNKKEKGREDKTLGEVSTLYQGLAINKKTKYLLVEKSSLPLLRIKDLRNNTHEQYVAETGYPINTLVKENEIIYTRTGNSLGLVFRGRKGILHNNSFKIIPNDSLSNDYLFWWLQHDAFTSKIFALASKAAQPDITHKLFKAQVISVPTLKAQAEYFKDIEKLNRDVNSIVSSYNRQLSSLEELKKSILQKAFAGELTNSNNGELLSPEEKHALLIIWSYSKHRNAGTELTFGHTKSEKLIHLYENYVGINLNRNPIKDAAGPNDFSKAIDVVEPLAKKEKYYTVTNEGLRYTYGFSKNSIKGIKKIEQVLSPLQKKRVEKVISLFLNEKTEQSELFATIYAAWNNLIIQKHEINDEAIVYEARENWHQSKLKIERSKFFDTINKLRASDIIPEGNGNLVEKPTLF